MLTLVAIAAVLTAADADPGSGRVDVRAQYGVSFFSGEQDDASPGVSYRGFSPNSLGLSLAVRLLPFLAVELAAERVGLNAAAGGGGLGSAPLLAGLARLAAGA